MQKKAAIITGASRGIGKAAAAALARAGWRVMINYFKSKDEALALAGSLTGQGFEAEAFRADVSDYGEAAELVGRCAARFGGVDLLVNNAGTAQIKPFAELDETDWDRMIQTNLKSVFNCSHSALKYMLPQKSGGIINISSVWGMTGASCEVHYSAAKAGVIGFTKALAKELAPSGIRVNCIAPGVIATDMLTGLSPEELRALKDDIPSGAIGTPEDVAACAVFLASPDSRYITGQVISPNGGYVI